VEGEAAETMKFDRNIPEGRARFYRRLSLSVFVGVTWSLVLGFLAAVSFDVMPTLSGWPVVHGVWEHLPQIGHYSEGVAEHWLLSSKCRLEVRVRDGRLWHYDPWPEEPTGWMRMPPSNAPPGSSKTTRAFGWPFRCLIREGTLVPPIASGSSTPPTSPRITIPNRVYLPGLLADVGVYAAPVFVMGWCVGASRRCRRRRRGACEGCGYSLVGLTDGVCPECGSAR
jgi:hypothetical protein